LGSRSGLGRGINFIPGVLASTGGLAIASSSPSPPLHRQFLLWSSVTHEKAFILKSDDEKWVRYIKIGSGSHSKNPLRLVFLSGFTGN
jgi:hypothetical protein